MLAPYKKSHDKPTSEPAKLLSHVQFCDPMDCSLPGSSIHGIFQARVLEWVTISFSRGSSQPRDQTQVSCTVGRHLTIWATREEHIKKQRHYFASKGLYSQSYGFSSSHVRLWALDHKEGWVPNNWCFQTVVLDKTLESTLGYKEIKPVIPYENKPWIFTGRTETEALILDHLMQRANSLEKTLTLERIEGKRRRGWQRMRWLNGITNSIDWIWANSGR